jgi:predicted lipase
LDAAHSTLPTAKAKDGVGRVHSGFQDAYESVRKGLISHMIKLRTNYDGMWRRFEVEITGHSLGGALSTLLAVELEALGFRIARVTTFGSPRVGDWRFADYYDEKLGDRTHRFTHAHDAVPSLPPRLLGYHHVATEVFQNAEGEYVVGDGSGEDPNGSDSEWTHASLSDHLTYLGMEVCSCNMP